jgi:hypothetical protein
VQPHRTETFELSPDPFWVDKVRDIVVDKSDVATSSGYAGTRRDLHEAF